MTKIQALHKRLTGLGFKCDLYRDHIEIAFAGEAVRASLERGRATPWETEDRAQIIARLADDVRCNFTFTGALKRAETPEERAAIIASQRRALEARQGFTQEDVRRAAARLAEEQAKLAQVDADLKALEELT